MILDSVVSIALPLCFLGMLETVMNDSKGKNIFNALSCSIIIITVNNLHYYWFTIRLHLFTIWSIVSTTT